MCSSSATSGSASVSYTTTFERTYKARAAAPHRSHTLKRAEHIIRSTTNAPTAPFVRMETAHVRARGKFEFTSHERSFLSVEHASGKRAQTEERSNNRFCENLLLTLPERFVELHTRAHAHTQTQCEALSTAIQIPLRLNTNKKL